MKKRYTYNQFTGSPMLHGIEVGVCWGTRETDECSCGGDRTKCDFYPEVRAKAKNKATIQDAINHFKYGISHDIFSEPVTTYAEMAIDALEEQVVKGDIKTNADKIRSMNDEELAEFLNDYHNNDVANDEICHAGLCLEDEDCVGCTLKWLQRPVKE